MGTGGYRLGAGDHLLARQMAHAEARGGMRWWELADIAWAPVTIFGATNGLRRGRGGTQWWELADIAWAPATIFGATNGSRRGRGGMQWWELADIA